MNARADLHEPPTSAFAPANVLTIAQKTAEIEQLAGVTGLTPHMTMAILNSVAADTFTGAALRDAWMKAELAIAIRDGTDLADQDYEMYAEGARAAIRELAHGPQGLPGESTPLFSEVVSDLGVKHLVTSQGSATDEPG